MFLSSVAPLLRGVPTNYADVPWRLEAKRAVENAGYFQGDIIVPEGESTKVAAVTSKKRLWPGGVIPYTVDEFFRYEEKIKHVRQWMNMIEHRTCLRFVERTWEPDYVHIYSGVGCYSYVGRHGGEQALSLGRGCLYEGTVVHELMHAAGFYHMHTHPDRDKYLDIFWSNIDSDYIDHFEKNLEEGDPLVPFDTSSVMLYAEDAFVRRPGLKTMKAKDGRDLVPLYNKTGLSDSDILSITVLYNCTKRRRREFVGHVRPERDI